MGNTSRVSWLPKGGLPCRGTRCPHVPPTGIRHPGHRRGGQRPGALPPLRRQPQDRLQVDRAVTAPAAPTPWPTARDGPRLRPARCPEAIEAEVLRLRDEHPAWGGRKLRARLVALGHDGVPGRQHHHRDPPPPRPARPRPRPRPRPFIRFEHDAPNRLWQMDFKGHFATGSGRCHPLTVLDDHSRFDLGLLACADERDGTVRGHLTALFRRYGLPERILCDNGSPWGTGRLGPAVHGAGGLAAAAGRRRGPRPGLATRRPRARTSGSTAPSRPR